MYLQPPTSIPWEDYHLTHYHTVCHSLPGHKPYHFTLYNAAIQPCKASFNNLTVTTYYLKHNRQPAMINLHYLQLANFGYYNAEVYTFECDLAFHNPRAGEASVLDLSLKHMVYHFPHCASVGISSTEYSVTLLDFLSRLTKFINRLESSTHEYPAVTIATSIFEQLQGPEKNICDLKNCNDGHAS